MRKLLITTALAGLFGIAGALAQPDKHEDRGRGHEDRPQAAQPENRGGGNRGAENRAPDNRGAQMRAPDRRGPEARPAAQPAPPRAAPPVTNAMRAPDRGRVGNDNRGRVDNGNRARDFASYRRVFTAPRRFHVAAYQRPRGWYPHRWTYGEILPAFFWVSTYWLNDWSYYGLEPPPPGTVWVRDGSDALLIDRYNGEIIEVAYDVFY